MTTLRDTIKDLADDFANAVLDAIQGASLQDLVGAGGGSPRGRRPGRPVGSGAGPKTGGRSAGKGRRLHRRSQAALDGVVGKIISLLKASPKGLRSEQIRSKLGLLAKELPRPIAMALSEKKITKKGNRRATTYFAK